jgi:hypothetical protein
MDAKSSASPFVMFDAAKMLFGLPGGQRGGAHAVNSEHLIRTHQF